MAINLDWKIRSRSSKCGFSGKDFADGEEFYTCIFKDPDSDGFLRKDFSTAVWEEARATLRQEPYSRWKSVFRLPEVEPEADAIHDNSAEGMLRKMLDEDDPATENTRYILALMLERKKVLLPVDVKQSEARRLLFYEHKESGDVFIVADPQLKLDEIGTIQAEITSLLNQEETTPRHAPGKESPDPSGGGEGTPEILGDSGTENDSEN